MFCTKCGTNNPDGANTCATCGAALGATNAATKKSGFDLNALLGKINVSKLLIPAVIVAVAVIGVIVFTILSNASVKPVKNYWKAIQEKDVKLYMEAYPEDVTEDWDKDAKKNTLKSEYNNYKEEYGSDLKISVKVLDKDKLDKDELDEFKDTLESVQKMYPPYKDLDVDEITAAYRIAVKVTTKGDDEKGVVYDTYTVIKYDGEWCLLP